MDWEIENYVNGNYESSCDKRSYYIGNNRLTINNVSKATLSAIKRQKWKLYYDSDQIDDDILVRIVKDLSLRLPRSLDPLWISSITNLDISYIKHCISEFSNYAKALPDEINSYKRLFQDGKTYRYSYYVSGPTTLVLPQNAFIDAWIVIVNCMLAKSPLLIRGSSRWLSTFSAILLVNILRESISHINTDGKSVCEYLQKYISVINYWAVNGTDHVFNDLVFDDGYFVIIGGHRVSKDVSVLNLAKNTELKIYSRYMSGAYVANLYMIENSIREITEGYYFNAGKDCVSTSVLFMNENIITEFIKELSYFLDKDNKKLLINGNCNNYKYKDLTRNLKNNLSYFIVTLIDNIIECKDTSQNSLYIVGIKDVHDLCGLKFVSFSVFGKDANEINEIERYVDSHNLLYNISTHKINLLAGVNGENIYEVLLKKRMLNK